MLSAKERCRCVSTRMGGFDGKAAARVGDSDEKEGKEVMIS